jgi:transposase-like protein
MDRKGKTGRRYSTEEKAAVVRMVRTLRAELGTDRGAAQRVALQLGYGVESVRSWVGLADIDDGLTGHHPQSDCEMSFAGPWRSQKNEISRTGQISARDWCTFW